MDSQERTDLLEKLEQEQKRTTQAARFSAVFKNKTVWGLVVTYFFWMTGFYGFTLWVPSIVKSFTQDSVAMGLLTAIPFVFALVGMVVNSIWSDRRMNRVQHVVVPLLIAALSMICGQFVSSPAAKMVFLAITAMGLYAPYGPLWAIPTAIIPAAIVGAALGLQNVLGNLGGFFGPSIFGKLEDMTGNDQMAFFFLALSLILAAIATGIVGRRLPKKAKTPS